jgi:hypothetical protein
MNATRGGLTKVLTLAGEVCTLLEWRSRRTQLAARWPLLIALVLPCAPTLAADAERLAEGVELPRLESKALSGSPVSLPHDARGHAVVLVLGFSKAASQVTRPWMEGCRAAAAGPDSPSLFCYDVRMVEDVPGLFRSMMERAMKGSLPAELLPRTLLVYEANGAWRERVGAADDKTAYVIACDAEGRVRRVASGPFEKSEMERILAAIVPGAESARWPIPAGWKHETFSLPPEFAPTLPYQGTEDLRFMPGFSSQAAPDFWSYDFVWWLDQRPPFDATSLAGTLTIYFRGLATAVGGSKYHLDPARYRAVLTAVPASDPPRLTGQVFTYDPFATGLPLTLNVEAELRSCPSSKQTAIVVALSPKAAADSVWKSLRTTAATLVCH